MWYIDFNTDGLTADLKTPANVSIVNVSYMRHDELQAHARFDHKPTPEDVAKVYAECPELYGRARWETVSYEREAGDLTGKYVHTFTRKEGITDVPSFYAHAHAMPHIFCWGNVEIVTATPELKETPFVAHVLKYYEYAGVKPQVYDEGITHYATAKERDGEKKYAYNRGRYSDMYR